MASPRVGLVKHLWWRFFTTICWNLLTILALKLHHRCIDRASKTPLHLVSGSWMYGGLFLSRLPSVSNISLSRTKCSVPWNFPQEHCIAFLYFELLYLELFPISNKFSGPLNHFLSLSRTFTYSNLIFEFPNKFKFESKQIFQP